MSSYPIQFYGNIEGSNVNNSVLKNITYPSFGTIIEATNYLVRDGLFAFVSGSLYYKKSGSSSPVRFLDSNVDGTVLSGSVKDVSNFQISGSQLKFDVLYNSGSSKQLSLNIASLQTDTTISNVEINPSTYLLSITQTNSDIKNASLGAVTDNYVRNEMISSNNKFSVDTNKLATRGTINTYINNLFNSNVLQVGKGLSQRYEGVNGGVFVDFGEVNPTSPNVKNNTKFILSASAGQGYGSLITYANNGEIRTETYSSADDLTLLLISGSNRTPSWVYDSAVSSVNPELNWAMLSSVSANNTIGNTNASQIICSAGLNTLTTSTSIGFGITTNEITQYSNETQITSPIKCIGDLNQNIVSSSNLIHRGYVDTNFLNISGGILLGVSGSGSIGYKAQNIKPSTPSSGYKLYANSTNALSLIGTNGYIISIDGTSNTADRTYTLPNASGTIVLTTDLTTYAPILNPTFSGSVSISGSINSSGSIKSQGLTVGRGSGNVTTNSAFGTNALLANTSGGENTAIGNGALKTNTTGFWNTAVGSNALNLSVATIYNVAVGTNSQLNTTAGSHNTSVGYNTLLSNLSGSHNTAIGKTALTLNTGEYNTAVGSASGNGNNQGSKNTYIGYNTGGGITTGNSNTIIGANVSGLSSSLSNNIIIADGDGNKRIVSDNLGRIGIGTTTPDVSAILDLTSTTQGLLLPRMTTTQINAISTPSAGLMVYNSTLGCPCFYDGTTWRRISHSTM